MNIGNKIKNNSTTTVALVLCTCNNNKSIYKTLKSIKEQTAKPEEFILIHQGAAFAELQKNVLKLIPSSTIVHDNSFGLSRARNLAYSISHSDWIAYTDDDVVLTENWIEEIKRSVNKDPDLGILGGKIIPVFEEKNPNFKLPPEFEYCLPAYTKEYNYGPYTEQDLPAGANLIVSRSIFKNVGSFKIDLGLNAGKKQQIYGEDSYFCQAAKNLGYKVYYNPKLVVKHPVPLERQSIKYVKKRLINEGYTKSYILFNYRKKNRVKAAKHIRKLMSKIIKSAIKNDLEKYITIGQIKFIATNIKYFISKNY